MQLKSAAVKYITNNHGSLDFILETVHLLLKMKNQQEESFNLFNMFSNIYNVQACFL